MPVANLGFDLGGGLLGLVLQLPEQTTAAVASFISSCKDTNTDPSL